MAKMACLINRYTKDVSKVPKRVLETKKERSAVQCLSDTVVAPPPSGIGEIINQRRKERLKIFLKCHLIFKNAASK